MKHLRPIDEKKPKGAPDWHDSDAPDANGRFRDLSPKKLAAWLIKTRKKDVKRISGSLTQQVVFNRNEDPEYADKMERTRKEVYKQLGRKDLLDRMDEGKESVLNEKVSGENVWNHIVSITPEEDDIPWGFQDKIEGNNFKETKVDLKKLLKTDPDFAEYYKGGEERYDQDEIDEFDVYYELVVVDGELLDGYSRAARLLRQGEKKANAFVAESLMIEGNYKIKEIYDLIAHHRFNKDYDKLDKKLKDWVENDAKERGFKESLEVSILNEMFYSLIDELYEAKPGPDAYMTGLSDKEKEEKEAKMKKQAAMDDDDPDSYEEMPGDKEARESGKVKKSKHTTAYHKKFKKESMKNIKSFDSFILLRESKEDFKPHMMYDPKTGKGYKAETQEDHEKMNKLGYVHEKPEEATEAFIGPFVFNDKMSDEELLGMYNSALDGYANYSKGFQHSKSDYKRAYQEIEKILKKRGIKVDESIIIEATRGAIHKAAKKGSYPVTIVVIKDGKVIAQELVKTPQSVPATFNVLQSYHKHDGATVRIESRTGETLFQESIGLNERFNEYSFKFGNKDQFGIDDVNVAYGFWGTLEMHYDEEQVSISWEDAFDCLVSIYKFSEEGALYYLNSKAGRHLADKFSGGEFYNLEETMEDYAKPAQWKKWAKEYNQYAIEENVKEALLIEKTTVASIIDAAEMEMETPGINKNHLKQIIRRKKENRLYTIDSKAEKTLRKLLGKYKIEEAETLAELQKMSKKEWKKTKAFNKHITKAGDKYVMAYDDKIGTYLDPVEIIDEGLFNDEDTENYNDALETAKKYGIPIAVAVATIAAMGLAGAIALFKKGARKVAQWVDRNADAIPESIKAIALEESSSLLIEDEQTTNDQSPLGDEGMETGIKNKAKESGVPVGLLRIIMRRGLAAWKTGHRPGATQAQWGYARVNSFLTKQPGTWGKADSDIAKKVRDGGHDKNL